MGFLYNLPAGPPQPPEVRYPVTETWFEDTVCKEIVDSENDAYVMSVKFCKRTIFPEHEFLIVELEERHREAPTSSDRNPVPRKSVVLIERCRKDRKDNNGA